MECRSPKKLGSEEKVATANITKVPQKVSDSVAEGVLQCLEELLTKCLLGSVDQVILLISIFMFHVHVDLLVNVLLGKPFMVGVFLTLKTNQVIWRCRLGGGIKFLKFSWGRYRLKCLFRIHGRPL